MWIVVRVMFIYFFLLIAMRGLGKREFAQLSAHEVILLLVISETLQQAMVGDDFSMTAAIIAASTLMLCSFLMSVITYRFRKVGDALSGDPAVLVHEGKLLKRNMDLERVASEEIFAEMRRIGLDVCSRCDGRCSNPMEKSASSPSKPGARHRRTTRTQLVEPAKSLSVVLDIHHSIRASSPFIPEQSLLPTNSRIAPVEGLNQQPGHTYVLNSRSICVCASVHSAVRRAAGTGARGYTSRHLSRGNRGSRTEGTRHRWPQPRRGVADGAEGQRLLAVFTAQGRTCIAAD
jgi:hypothetical protein